MNEKMIREHTFYKYADKVYEICSPLSLNTPVNYFAFGKIYSNNDYVGLLSDKAWAHYYLKNDFYIF